MALGDYEAAAVRSWALDHAHKLNRARPIATMEDIIEDAKVIEAYLSGRPTGEVLRLVKGKNGRGK